MRADTISPAVEDVQETALELVGQGFPLVGLSVRRIVSNYSNLHVFYSTSVLDLWVSLEQRVVGRASWLVVLVVDLGVD